ncbi:MAG TPA: tRNA pseudouridine(55) synthase TruB [Gammaproteobacteria bacterium]|nr:tRNA pseudouridine(55) synthase TruB [Gammaproteobacteria bacterium]
MLNRIAKRKINGILLVDKHSGLSSNDMLQKVKRLLNAEKAGHTGSLDPIATGMLPLCLGEATKFSQFLLDSDKHYYVTAKLGKKTATGDTEGEVVVERSFAHVTRERLENVMRPFYGKVEQIPPMYSALKHKGKPLYELARKGIEVEREPRQIHIHSLQLDSFEGDTFSFSIHCSKGTYVRTLVDDIGELLDCGAHVYQLRRTAVAPYTSFPMYKLEVLEDIYQKEGIDGLTKLLLPIETSVAGFPSVMLSTSAAFYIRMGQPVRVTNAPPKGLVRLMIGDEQKFLGMGEMLEDYRVKPKRMVV